MTRSTFDVIDVMTGYQPPAVLTAAARLGVFDLLAVEPATVDEVAMELGLDPGATRALLDALVGLDLATLDGDRYSVDELAARLGTGGDLRLVAEKEAFFARVWLDLADSVRTGTPAIDPWRARLVSDPAQARQFLEALVVLAAETGPDLAALVGIGAGTRVVDLGGGLGSYAVPLAAAGAQVTLVDLPPVAGWAAEAVAAADPAVADRIEVRPLDLLADGAAAQLGAEADVALVSHLLHDLDDADAATALAVARDVVRPGGTVVVFELPGDPPGAFGPLFDLMMRVETGSAARRIDELGALLVAAGLTDVGEVAGATRPHGILSGRRPAGSAPAG